MIVSTDVGGTFTDYVLLDEGKINAFKALSTSLPSKGIIENLNQEGITEFSHGTTVAINSLIERNGGPVIFFTTKGFGDLIRIGRQARLNVYDFLCKVPKVPVNRIIEVEERVNSKGEVVKLLSKTELKNIAENLAKKNSVAVIGFINSYKNIENEMAAESVLSEYFQVVIPSYELRREIREYDRFCTAVIEGYCTPVVKNYLKELEHLSSEFYIMQSNGGKADVEHLKASNIVMSGPAGGVAASQLLCKRFGIQNAIVYDMGGTSVDVSAIVSAEPQFTDSISIQGIPLKTLAIDIESIGAGGSSIAWLDDGGALKVGPMSAGSEPGPACYHRGGIDFTVSDANLILGILSTEISNIKLDEKLALDSARNLCQSLNLEPKELANGVRRIVNNNMVAAIKNISIGRGFDPREFTLIAFGGAGPMHACEIASQLGIKRIIIPPMAGAFSALGILSAPIRFDYVRTILKDFNHGLKIIPKIIEEFKKDLKEKMGVKYHDALTQVSLDMRYKGQGHEINIPFNNDYQGELENGFHQKHSSLFGFSMQENDIEVVNVKMVSELFQRELVLNQYPDNKPIELGKREVYSDGLVPSYRREFHNSEINGPCIIEENTTTTYVSKGWHCVLDNFDVLYLNLEGD